MPYVYITAQVPYNCKKRKEKRKLVAVIGQLKKEKPRHSHAHQVVAGLAVNCKDEQSTFK